MVIRRFLTLSLLLCQVVFSDNFTLSEKDVRNTMDKMFAYHVENRDFSPLVVRRSFKIYLDQFDRERVYLLKDEARPFLKLSDKQIEQIKRDYNRDRFPEYAKLNQTIETAILRNRALRQEQIAKIVSEGPAVLTKRPPNATHHFPASLDELSQRVYWRLVKELIYTAHARGITEMSPELMLEILTFREKKNISFEKSYLSFDKEESSHNLTLHILRALPKSLDAHSGYYSPREAYEIRASLKKEFSGVGIVLREDFDGIIVTDLVKGGPAERSHQVSIGDHLIALNHQKIGGKSFEEVLEIMKGKAGTSLILGVEDSNGHTTHVECFREKIIMNDDRITLAIEPYADGVIGKIKVPGFYDNGGQVSVEKDLREAIRTLKHEGKVYGIVLDFRENLGGFLTQAVKVSGMFINGGLIVVSKYADGEVSYARDIDGRHYYNGPLVILTSKASASAAEIVAGALQDHGVAIVVGDERSYGKGSMQFQTLTDESARSFFKVTVGRYFTASGRSPQIEGVKADIVVPTRFNTYNIGERYLEYPLSNEHLSGEIYQSIHQAKQGELRSFAVPHLKPRESAWRKMLVQLSSNSQKRLQENKDFQSFLDGTKKRSSNYGVEDMQMHEAVEILKDMTILSN